MTQQDVQGYLDLIRSAAADPEATHGYEDDLYLSVLGAIARGEVAEPAAVASLAISSQNIDFERWCA